MKSTLIVFIAIIAACFLSVQSSVTTVQCGNSIQSLTNLLNSTASCPQISSVIGSLAYYETCTVSNKGLNCLNVEQVFGVVDAQNSAEPILGPYSVGTSSSSCLLCDSKANSLKSSCNNILQLINEIVLGSKLTYDAAYYNVNSTMFNNAVQSVRVTCSGSVDSTVLSFLNYQSDLVCSQSNTYGYPKTSYSNLEGALDMRSTLQCGYCAVIPCVYGQYCAENSVAVSCPAGSYCPDPTQKIPCPSGYFCPAKSISPIKCRATAAGTCIDGTTREVVWVPLFIVLILLIGVFMWYQNDSLITPSWWMKIVGLPRPDAKVYTDSNDMKRVKDYTQVNVSKPNNTNNSLQVSIEFQDIVMITGKTKRISGVSGNIKAGRFTAVLGGSGAGKTSFMNAVLAREQVTSGVIKFHAKDVEKPLNQRSLNRMIGFVPQTDVLIRSMTVYQVIKHSAQTRLPPSYTPEMIEQQIEHVIDQLGIQNIRDVIIGGDEDYQGQGLSSGDRKKTNIAVELVSSPSVLFLDEPTSGIDASSALTVATIVRDLSRQSLTCVAIIHQPRGEIFDLIDDLILLIPGGKIAYQGPMKYAIGWFNKFGYELPHPKANRTDFLLDVTCNQIPKSDPTIPDEEWDIRWIREGNEYLKSCGVNDVDHALSSSNPETTTEQNESDIVNNIISRPSIFYLTYLHAKRGFLQRIKGDNLKLFLVVHLIAGIIMGIITCGGSLVTLPVPGSYKLSCPPGAETLCNQWERFQIGPSCFLINSILGCITIPTAVNTFGREKEISFREAAVGVRPFTYWLGKLLADIPFCIIGSFFYVAPIAAIAPWRADTGNLYIAVLLLSLFITGFGYNLSFLYSNPDNATLAGAILAILFNLFGGFVPNLGDDPQGAIFYTKYISRLVVTAELFGSGITDTPTFNEIVPPPWQDPSFNTDVGIMVIFIAATYALSYIGIRYNLRKVKL